MDEALHKKVDESWKERVEQEKQQDPGGPEKPSSPITPTPEAESAQGQVAARFDLFVSSLAMEALIALGEVPHPVTRKQAVNLNQARYLIDILGLLEEKTRGNLTVDEDRLVKDTLYQLRMRYLAKSGG